MSNLEQTDHYDQLYFLSVGALMPAIAAEFFPPDDRVRTRLLGEKK